MHTRWLLLALTVWLATLSGCCLPTGLLRSRWAMDDPEYAEKYAAGAKKSDVLGKIKQASDARFMDQATGTFISSGVAYRPDSDYGLFNIDVGGETYATSYMTGRMSLMGLVNSSDWFVGVDTGLRLQTPTRLAPFVGVGANTGFASETVIADDDWEDNDDDGIIDEYGEKDWRISGAYISVYPEVGSHFWWTPELRLSTYGRYMVSSEGRRADDWLIGASVAIFTNPFFK